MTITHQQLEDGADAVSKLAAKYGVGGWISRDQEREIAADVIESYQKNTKET
jgi:hypothetical protein